MFAALQASPGSFMKLTASSSGSPRYLRIAFTAALRKSMLFTPGNLHRVLEGEEHARAGALLRLQFQQVRPLSARCRR
jgi:hypothetical protein